MGDTPERCELDNVEPGNHSEPLDRLFGAVTIGAVTGGQLVFRGDDAKPGVATANFVARGCLAGDLVTAEGGIALTGLGHADPAGTAPAARELDQYDARGRECVQKQ